MHSFKFVFLVRTYGCKHYNNMVNECANCTFNLNWLFLFVAVMFKNNFMVLKRRWQPKEQECIPVGCVPPACWPYPSMHCGGDVPARGVPAKGLYLPRGVPAGGDLPRRCTCLGGVPAQGGVPAWGCTCPGVYLPGGYTCLRGCTCSGGIPARGVYLGRCTCPGTPPPPPPPWTEWLTDSCKNITFANFVCGRL